MKISLTLNRPNKSSNMMTMDLRSGLPEAEEETEGVDEGEVQVGLSTVSGMMIMGTRISPMTSTHLAQVDEDEEASGAVVVLQGESFATGEDLLLHPGHSEEGLSEAEEDQVPSEVEEEVPADPQVVHLEITTTMGLLAGMMKTLRTLMMMEVPRVDHREVKTMVCILESQAVLFPTCMEGTQERDRETTMMILAAQALIGIQTDLLETPKVNQISKTDPLVPHKSLLITMIRKGRMGQMATGGRMEQTQILELPSKQLTTMKAVQVADLTEAPNQILDQDRQANLEQILVRLISTMQVLDLLADLDSVLQGVSVKDHSRAFLKVMSQTLGTLHLVNAPCSLTWSQTLATGLHVGHREDLTFNPILATVPLGDVQVDRTLSQTLVMDRPEDPKGQALDQTSEAAHRDDPREDQRSSLTLVAALPEGHRVAPRSGQTLVEVRREEAGAWPGHRGPS